MHRPHFRRHATLCQRLSNITFSGSLDIPPSQVSSRPFSFLADISTHRRRFYPKLVVPLTWLQPVDLSGLARRQQLLSELYDPARPAAAAALTRELEIFQEEQHVLALSSAHLAWQRARQMKR